MYIFIVLFIKYFLINRFSEFYSTKDWNLDGTPKIHRGYNNNSFVLN